MERPLPLQDPRASRLELLGQLSELVTEWRGTARLGGRDARVCQHLYHRLARGGHRALEGFRMAALRWCLDAAQEKAPPGWLREAWLVEVWTWQRLLEKGGGNDFTPEYVPPNPHFGKGAIEMQLHRWPPGRL